MAILILCSDWWSDYRGKGIWGNRVDYQNTSLLDGNLRTCIIRWGAASLKKMSLHDELHMILSLYASWKPFCYFSLTVSEDYPGFWKIKSCCSCSHLPSFPEGWEEPWWCTLFQGCGQLLGQQLSTSSRVLLFGKGVSCSLLETQGALFNRSFFLSLQTWWQQDSKCKQKHY